MHAKVERNILKIIKEHCFPTIFRYFFLYSTYITLGTNEYTSVVQEDDIPNIPDFFFDPLISFYNSILICFQISNSNDYSNNDVPKSMNRKKPDLKHHLSSNSYWNYFLPQLNYYCNFNKYQQYSNSNSKVVPSNNIDHDDNLDIPMFQSQQNNTSTTTTVTNETNIYSTMNTGYIYLHHILYSINN